MNIASSDRVRVVTVGGGTGSSVLLRGLKRYVDRIDITAIVTTFDDGGSSGGLRKEFGVPALGDLRRCVGALLPEDARYSPMEGMFEHRFSSDGPIDGHSLGNLMLLAEMQRIGGLSDAIDSIARRLNLAGSVLPVCEEPSNLCAELSDGTLIRGESGVGDQNEVLFGASRIYLDPPVAANPRAVAALRNADVVILGPGDLFASVIPNLLPDGVIEAIGLSSCRILQVCNIAMKEGEMVGYAASDFVKSANRYLSDGNNRVGAIVVNTPESERHGVIRPIECDDEVHGLVDDVLERRVFDESAPRLHDSEELAAAVMDWVDAVIESR